MSRIDELKTILSKGVYFKVPQGLDKLAQEIDALYSVDGDLREKIAKNFYEKVYHLPWGKALKNDVEWAYEHADSILQMIAKAGWVKLDIQDLCFRCQGIIDGWIKP